MFEAFQKQGTLKACACFIMQSVLVALRWIEMTPFLTPRS